MTGRQLWRGTLPGVLAVAMTLTACGDSNPSAIPYQALGRDLAGVYNATAPEAVLDLRLVLGTRHTVTGRYEPSPGQIVRFGGTWERRGNTLFVTLDSQNGLPSGIEFDISRETILTEIEPGPFSLQPENQPLFLEQKVLRLTGAATVAGIQLDLELIRVITDVVSGGGGQTAN